MISLILLVALLCDTNGFVSHGTGCSGTPTRMTVTATAYTDRDPGLRPGDPGCHPSRKTRTADGRHKPGIAVDPCIIKLGSRVSLDGGKSYILADDTGGAIHGCRIDIRMASRHAALQFGRRQVEILVRR